MENKSMKAEAQEKELRRLREEIGLNRREFAELFCIPLRTIEDWEAGRRRMPEYLMRLISYKVRMEKLYEKDVRENVFDKDKRSITIITEADGKKIVLINDIRFKSRRKLDWNEVEKYLKEYIGKYFEISESSERIYVGTDFPDEFSHSKDTKALKGANEKAKANIVPAVNELIQIATNKMEYPDYDNKHKGKAKYGWYRYDTRFGIPVYDASGELTRYNIFQGFCQ